MRVANTASVLFTESMQARDSDTSESDPAPERAVSAAADAVPVLRPTKEEWYGGFGAYLAAIRPLLDQHGAVQLVPPPEWRWEPRALAADAEVRH